MWLFGKPCTEEIRKAPAKLPMGGEDYRFTTTPITFIASLSNGEMLVKVNGKEEWLPAYFNDGQWVPANNPYVGVKTELHKWKGKMVRRKVPVVKEERFFVENAVKLISATRYHVVVETKDGERILLDVRFTKPEEWELANEK